MCMAPVATMPAKLRLQIVGFPQGDDSRAIRGPVAKAQLAENQPGNYRRILRVTARDVPAQRKAAQHLRPNLGDRVPIINPGDYPGDAVLADVNLDRLADRNLLVL